MSITPEDVIGKRFRTTAFRAGYDQQDVDNFMDEVAITLRELYSENILLKEELDDNSRY